MSEYVHPYETAQKVLVPKTSKLKCTNSCNKKINKEGYVYSYGIYKQVVCTKCMKLAVMDGVASALRRDLVVTFKGLQLTRPDEYSNLEVEYKSIYVHLTKYVQHWTASARDDTNNLYVARSDADPQEALNQLELALQEHLLVIQAKYKAMYDEVYGDV